MSEIPFSQGMRSIKPTSARPLLDEGCKIQSKTSRSIISNNKIVDSSGFDGADGNVLEDEHEVGKLSPPRSAVKNAFEKPIAIRNSVDRPPSGTKGVQRPRSSRRPPSRTLRDRLSVIRQDARYLNFILKIFYCYIQFYYL